jgi:hypothetical protein
MPTTIRPYLIAVGPERPFVDCSESSITCFSLSQDTLTSGYCSPLAALICREKKCKRDSSKTVLSQPASSHQRLVVYCLAVGVAARMPAIAATTLKSRTGVKASKKHGPISTTATTMAACHHIINYLLKNCENAPRISKLKPGRSSGFERFETVASDRLWTPALTVSVRRSGHVLDDCRNSTPPARRSRCPMSAPREQQARS